MWYLTYSYSYTPPVLFVFLVTFCSTLSIFSVTVLSNLAPGLLNSWTTSGRVIWTLCSTISSIFSPTNYLILSNSCSLSSLSSFIKVTYSSNLLMASTYSVVPVSILMHWYCCVVTIFFNSTSKEGRVKIGIEAKGWYGCVSVTYLNHLND